MFWRFGGYANISTLDSILDKPDVTVEELLDESDLIQELKQQNSKLVEFLREEPVLKKLLHYVVADELPDDAPTTSDAGDKDGEEARSPGLSFFGKGKGRSRSKSVSKNKADEAESEQEKREAQRKKYAYVACEVLSSEVWSITEAIMEHREHLTEFWQYMRRPAPLDPLQAGYFTKVNEALLDKKTEEMLSFFKSLDGIVAAMLQHVDCPMVMDLLLKIISLEKHEGGVGIVDWLQTQEIIPLLLGYLSPEHNNATQTSAGDFLKAIITISANATTQDQSVIGPNELTRQLVSKSCIQSLISEMLRGGNALTVGVGIIIEVIRKNNSDYDVDSQIGPEPKTSDPIYLGTLLRCFAEKVPDFMELIRSSSAKKGDMRAAFGGRIEPLGFERFKTCELMAELLHCSNMGLLNERGAEEDVKRRDAERERLKSEGKLATPRAPNTPLEHDNNGDEFGSSVDSHGFHHAERPSDDEMGEKTEVVPRPLEVQNANASDEDGFEKVNPRDADDLPDEVSFDELSERADQTGLPPLEKSEKRGPLSSGGNSPTESADMPKPLSPSKSKPAALLSEEEPAADSPTTAGLSEKVTNLDMDEDTLMTEFGEEPDDADDDGPSELEKELARSAEKPAPLFARKNPPALDEIDPIHGSKSADEQQDSDVDRSVATIQGDASTEQQDVSVNGERHLYETEADGSPVVGDLLKIQFVEHSVVPTILDFFFRFPWNNFLHNVVYDVVQQVFNGALERGYNRTVAFDLFRQIPEREGLGLLSLQDITTRILEGQAASDESQKKKGMRLGFMGHLTLIAEEVCKFGNRLPPEPQDGAEMVVRQCVEREEWVRYVETTLTETRDKDNAVLGGVRPENAIGMRAGSGGFGSNTSGLASAGLGNVAPQDSLALSEGTVGQSFEINSGTMVSGFSHDGDHQEDEDEAMMEEAEAMRSRDEDDAQRRHRAAVREAFGDDEQNFDGTDLSSPESNDKAAGAIPPPLNIPPSRARRQLAARLAQRKREAEGEHDPDAADVVALEAAERLEGEGEEGLIDMGPASPQSPIGGSGLQITGLRTVGGISCNASRFEGLFGSEDSSSEDDDFDEDDAGRDLTVGRAEGDYEQDDAAAGISRRRSGKDRRPSTHEAKERTLLDDEVDDMGTGMSGHSGLGEGPFADPLKLDDEDDDDSEDELIEIRPRRTS